MTAPRIDLADDPVLKPRQVTPLTGMCYQTVLARLNDGSLRGTRINGRWYVRRSSVDEFLAATNQQAEAS